MTQPEEPTPDNHGIDWNEQARRVGFTVFRGVREAAIIAVTALVLSITLRTFFFQLFYVPSESMLQTLQVGDKIVASKIHKTFNGVNRGDVVVFHDPGD